MKTNFKNSFTVARSLAKFDCSTYNFSFTLASIIHASMWPGYSCDVLQYCVNFRLPSPIRSRRGTRQTDGQTDRQRASFYNVGRGIISYSKRCSFNDMPVTSATCESSSSAMRCDATTVSQNKRALFYFGITLSKTIRSLRIRFWVYDISGNLTPESYKFVQQCYSYSYVLPNI